MKRMGQGHVLMTDITADLCETCFCTAMMGTGRELNTSALVGNGSRQQGSFVELCCILTVADMNHDY